MRGQRNLLRPTFSVTHVGLSAPFRQGLTARKLLTFYRYRRRICWPTPNGAPSVGAPARKESSRLVSPLSGCGSPTDHHSGSGTRANNICPATRLGSSANIGRQDRRNTISPTCQRRPTCTP